MKTSTIYSPLLATLIAGCASGILLGACDLQTKNIGMESDTASDDGDTDGAMCEEGDTMPAADGCNTCVCDEGGTWACTEIGCGDTGPGDDGPGGTCEPGDTMPAPDGCNTCSCDESGEWACTLLGCEDTGPGGECEPGDTMPAPDGCNECECSDDGFWGCTEQACTSTLPVCSDADPMDAFTINSAVIVGDELQASVTYSGGCAEHVFALCGDHQWLESFPVQTGLTITHDGMMDACDALPTEDIVLDLVPLQDAYAELYGPTGTVIVNLTNFGSLEYSF